jgi:hypothetical protein
MQSQNHSTSFPSPSPQRSRAARRRDQERAFGGRSGLLLLLLLLGSAGSALSVDYPLRWRWSNPRPHGGNIVDMLYIPGLGVTVQVAELGQIFSSADLSFWVARESGTTNDLRAVGFLAPYRRILVTGANGTVLYADNPAEFSPGILTTGATSDWLESVTTSPSLAVAVGDNGAIYTSTNGVHWKKQNSGTTQWLRSVTWGNGTFVAVGENGKLFTSVNGTNWVSHTSGTAEHLNRVTYASSRFTAVAEGGDCRFSTNSGVTWYPEATGAALDLFGTVSWGGTRLVAGDQEVRSQTGTSPWINELARPFGAPTAWTYYMAVRTTEFFLLAGRTGLMEEGYTTNSTLHWVPADESLRNWMWDVVYLSGLYVTVGDRATVLTSGNGASWRLEVVPPALTNSIFLGVGGTTNMLVAVGNAGSLMLSPNVTTNYWQTNVVGTNLIVSNTTGSAFGVLWYALPKVTTNDLQGVGANSNLFVASGANGTVVTSPDATNWTQRATPTTKFLSGVTSWPGGWVAVGDDGAVITSPNGLNWSPVAHFTTNWLYRVRYVGEKLLAVGQNGSIYTSSNGTSWTRLNSGTTKWLNDVTFVDNTWFAVGSSGTVLSSTNSTDWISRGTLTRKNLYGATTDSAQLITVGLEGVILRTQLIPDPTPIQILSYDRLTTSGPQGILAQNIYLFGGRPDQRFTLDHSSALDTNLWITGPQLEFFDGSGTLFYLETITSTNPLPHEYYRAPLILP